MKIILVNGPPGSGKDTACRIIRDLTAPLYTFHWEKFSLPHKLAFAALMNRSIDAEGNVDYYEEHKSEVIPVFGVSYRQWQIDFSEKFMKPLYGQDIFSRLLIQRLSHRIDSEGYLTTVSDCGFQAEFNYVAPHFLLSQLCLIRLHRKGTSFTGDSREWVYGGNHTNGHAIENNGTIEDLRVELKSLLSSWLGFGAKP